MTEKNPALLRTAMDNILKNPLMHDQNSWVSRNYDEDGGVCGTTMCLAGHVALKAGAQFPPFTDKDWDGDWHVAPNGEFRTSEQYYDDDYSDTPEDICAVDLWAREKLGLSYDETEYLFYFYGDAEALSKRVDKVLESWDRGEAFVDYYEEN